MKKHIFCQQIISGDEAKEKNKIYWNGPDWLQFQNVLNETSKIGNEDGENQENLHGAAEGDEYFMQKRKKKRRIKIKIKPKNTRSRLRNPGKEIMLQCWEKAIWDMYHK